MTTKLRKIEKVQFLVDELHRQAELYQLTLIAIVADEEEESYRYAAYGNTRSLIRQLAHSIMCVGREVKNNIEDFDTVFTNLMKLAIERIKEDKE